MIDKRGDKGHKDRDLEDEDHEDLLSQLKDLKGETVIPPSQAENKWTQACLIKSIDGHDRRWGSPYWNFRSEDNTWKGGMYLL